MYAVIKTGGKQQKVRAGDVIEVEKLVADGETVEFRPLLVVVDDGRTIVGADAAKAVVTAKPLGEKKGEKVKVFKYRPKSGYQRSQGHRQLVTLLEIEEVMLSPEQVTRKAEEAASEEEEAPPEEKAPARKKAAAKKPAAGKPTAKKPAAAKTPTPKKPTAKKAAARKKT